LLRREPRDPAAYHNLGTVYLRLGRREEAVAAYQESLRLRPNSPGTHFQLGNALRDGGRLREAVATWEEVLRLQPEHPGASEAVRQARASQEGS
jgi:protein O-GlcNAc transferase